MTDIKKLYIEILTKDELTPALNSANKSLGVFAKTSNSSVAALKNLISTSQMASNALRELNISLRSSRRVDNFNEMGEFMSSLILHTAAIVTIGAQWSKFRDFVKDLPKHIKLLLSGIRYLSIGLATTTKELITLTAAWIKNKAALAGNWLIATSARISLLTLAVMNNARAALVSIPE